MGTTSDEHHAAESVQVEKVILPDPPIPTYIDVRDLDGFMLNVERLMASELVALSSHEVIAAALFLWCRAWKQLPAASLPDDERVIAAFAKLPIAKFKKLRDQVMRGFVKCSDGRWYHTVLATEAFSAFGRKQSFQKKRETDAERLRKWRESQRETHNETPGETRFVAEGQGQGQGQVNIKTPTSQPDAHEPFRLFIGWQPSEHMPTLAKQAGVTIQGTKLAEFIAHWLTKPDKRTQAEWDKALLQSAQHDKLRAASPLSPKGKPKPENFADKSYGEGITAL